MMNIFTTAQDPLHFRQRKLEWCFALYNTLFGLWLLAPTPSMPGLAFGTLVSWLSEPEWGLLFGLTGTAHLVSLWVNGRRWWTPFTRALMSACAIIPFALFAAGFAHFNPWHTAVFTYGFGCCGAGFVSLYCAVKDAVHAWEVRRLGNA